MANAAQRARAEGELGIMKQLQEQHLLEQQRWQKRDNLQYFMQTVNPNGQGDVHPLHQAVMLHALGMAVPSNMLSGAAAGADAGASAAPVLPPSLMLAAPPQPYNTFEDKGVCHHLCTHCLISWRTCMPYVHILLPS